MDLNEYRVMITETFQKTVIVEASDEEQAIRRIRDAWNNTECVMEPECFSGVEFYVAGETGTEEKRLPRIESKNGTERVNWNEQ